MGSMRSLDDEVLDDLRAGRPILIVDSIDRPGEGDVVVAAERTTPEVINFMLREARGVVGVALSDERWRALALEPLAVRRRSPRGWDFGVSIEARVGVDTGVSAYDRARTIQVAGDPMTRPGDLVTPGHVVPVRAQPSGVLRRRGFAEAAVDAAELAGFSGAAAVCGVLTDDGRAARGAELQRFAVQHGLRRVSVEDIAGARRGRWREELLRGAA
jgi:3,4-dihydroxy 2-butanone 4-phosphate synthase/GTP cyclohydrolase II